MRLSHIVILAGLAFAAAILAPLGASAQVYPYGYHAPIPLAWESDISVPDNDTLVIGTGSDLSCTHNGTDTICTSSTGDFVIDNTDVNDPTVLRLGTDTSATAVQVQNNSGVPVFQVSGDGATTVAGSLVVGSGGLAVAPIDCGTTVGAESADTIAVVIACVDAGGDAVTAPVSLVVELYEASTLAALATEDVIAETGSGALIRTLETGTALQVMTSAAGAATITVTDTGGGSDTSRYLRIVDGGNIGGLRVVGSQDTITFDDTDSSP